MSLELCFTPSDDGGTPEYFLLDPGQGFFFTDHSCEQKLMIAVECAQDDSSRVRIFPCEGPFENGFEGTITEAEMPDSIGTIAIDEDHPFEDMITRDDETTGIISAQKVDSARITASFLIPILLRHPN